MDACVPAPLRRLLSGHEVKTAQDMGWSALANGELLRAVEAEFEVFITADKNVRYQQNLADRTLAIIVLPTNDWSVLKRMAGEVSSALSLIRAGELIELAAP